MFCTICHGGTHRASQAAIIEWVPAHEPLAHGLDGPQHLGRGRLAKAHQPLIGLNLDGDLRGARVEPTRPPHRRYERDVNGCRPQMDDAHVIDTR